MPILVKKWIERGREEGIHIGWDEGKKEGRWEGLQEGIRLALEIKFGREGLIFIEIMYKR